MNYKEFLDLLESFFSTNDNLKYVKQVTISADMNDVINGSFPVVNIEPSGFQFEKHPELMYKEYQKDTQQEKLSPSDWLKSDRIRNTMIWQQANIFKSRK